jgi:hypothetical protein
MRKKLISVLQQRARIVVRALHARPRRKPHRLQRLSRVLLSVVLSLLLSTTIQVTLKVNLTPCGNHPARDLD